MAANGGTFDMLAYGVRRLFGLFQRDVTKVKYKTFADYREAQRDRKRGFSHLLVVGGAGMLIAAIFLLLYYRV